MIIYSNVLACDEGAPFLSRRSNYGVHLYMSAAITRQVCNVFSRCLLGNQNRMLAFTIGYVYLPSNYWTAQGS